jgi:hypothetical protein
MVVRTFEQWLLELARAGVGTAVNDESRQEFIVPTGEGKQSV